MTVTVPAAVDGEAWLPDAKETTPVVPVAPATEVPEEIATTPEEPEVLEVTLPEFIVILPEPANPGDIPVCKVKDPVTFVPVLVPVVILTAPDDVFPVVAFPDRIDIAPVVEPVKLVEPEINEIEPEAEAELPVPKVKLPELPVVVTAPVNTDKVSDPTPVLSAVLTRAIVLLKIKS